MALCYQVSENICENEHIWCLEFIVITGLQREVGSF